MASLPNNAQATIFTAFTIEAIFISSGVFVRNCSSSTENDPFKK